MQKFIYSYEYGSRCLSGIRLFELPIDEIDFYSFHDQLPVSYGI